MALISVIENSLDHTAVLDTTIWWARVKSQSKMRHVMQKLQKSIPCRAYSISENQINL